jgi:hypothetical protein
VPDGITTIYDYLITRKCSVCCIFRAYLRFRHTSKLGFAEIRVAIRALGARFGVCIKSLQHLGIVLNVRIKSRSTVSNTRVIITEMNRLVVFASILLFVFGFGTTNRAAAQAPKSPIKSQEVSESDGIPVLVKHLPDWEKVQSQATFANNISTLKSAVGQRPMLDLIDFTAGTEAVTAQYPTGRLLIIEYASPQQSIEADNGFKNFLAKKNDGHTFYKRTGNYNILVFDAADEASANALIEQVKYEKNIQWLGEDPFLFHNLERAFVRQTSDLFFSTVEVIVLGMGLSVVGGLIAGFVYFQFRERRRASMNAFSDAGGMTRLNLDGFTPEISPDRLLSD